MPKICSICKRGTSSGFLKSHSQIKTKRMVKINMQSKKIGDKYVNVCANCIKTMAKPKKVK